MHAGCRVVVFEAVSALGSHSSSSYTLQQTSKESNQTSSIENIKQEEVAIRLLLVDSCSAIASC